MPCHPYSKPTWLVPDPPYGEQASVWPNGTPGGISSQLYVLWLGPVEEGTGEAQVPVSLGPFLKTSRVVYSSLLFYFETV